MYHKYFSDLVLYPVDYLVPGTRTLDKSYSIRTCVLVYISDEIRTNHKIMGRLP